MKSIAIALLLIIIGFVLLFFCKPKSKIEFQVYNIESDTVFQNPIWTGSDGYGKHISLRVIGKLDSSTEVFVKDPDYPDRFLTVHLHKGKFDTTWAGEYYEKKAEVIFLHKKAKKGNLKIIFRNLNSEGDTLDQ